MTLAPGCPSGPTGAASWLGPAGGASEGRDVRERALLATLLLFLGLLLVRLPTQAPSLAPVPPVQLPPLRLFTPEIPAPPPRAPAAPPVVRSVVLPGPPPRDPAPLREDGPDVPAFVPLLPPPLASPRHAPPAAGRPVRAGMVGAEPCVAVDAPEPEYPRLADALGLGGTVVLRVVVSRDGAVAEVEVLAGPGHGLEEAAVEAVRTWRYSPARLEGRPVPCELVVRVRFRPRR